MSQHIVTGCRGVAALLLLLVLGPSMSGLTGRPAHMPMRHAVMKPVPRAAGSSAATDHTLGTTLNWSGYALADFVTSTLYTSAQGSWVVPSVSYRPTSLSEPQTVASANWVGIGAACINASCDDQTLIQLGTESDAFSNGGTDYYAWYEMLPASAVAIPNPVSPGDVVTASLECFDSCTAGAQQAWLLSIVDQTKGWTFTQSFSYASSLISAEWIEEAPSDVSNKEFQLADFGQTSFTATLANGFNPNLNFLQDGIQMVDAQGNNPGQLANPSNPVASNAFSVCWGSTLLGNTPDFPACGYSGLPAPNTPQLVAAVLPSSRSVTVDATATVFATILNPASIPGNACAIQPLSNGNSFNGTFFYQTTDPATNTANGTPNTPVTIPANGSQSFVLGLTPELSSAPTNVEFAYVCQGELPVSPIFGVNTLAFSASTTPVPDVIAEVSTVTNDGTLHIPGRTGTGAFAVATANLGATGLLSVSANTGNTGQPLSILVCETDTATSQCLSPPMTDLPVTIAAGAEPTFSIFASAEGNVPFNPATTRIFVQFTDGTGTVRGSSSVAVTTD